MAAADLTEFVTASARNWSRTFADNITKHNAMLNRLQKRGKPIHFGDGCLRPERLRSRQRQSSPCRDGGALAQRTRQVIDHAHRQRGSGG